MIRQREETEAQKEKRLQHMRGADVMAPLYCDVQGYTVYLGQPEKIDLRVNRIAVPLASLTQLVHSIVAAMSNQAVGVIDTDAASPVIGGANGPT